ncbi:MAG: SDR family oxidoreductase [Steroidobacteraceae bacterium]
MLISGAGPGMGRSVAVLAARHGFDLALVARTAQTLEQTAELVRAAGASAFCVPADVSQPGQVASVVQQTLQRFGRIEALVHSILPPPLFKRILALEDADLESWRRSVEISIYGALLMARAAARSMAGAGRGSIVFVTATSALQGYPAVSAHAVGKAGIHSLMQCLASELGSLGVRANAMAVGVIDSATSRRERPDLDAQMQADVRRAVDAGQGALRRNITEREAAEAVLFLASEASSGITGQILVNDGGRLFH